MINETSAACARRQRASLANKQLANKEPSRAKAKGNRTNKKINILTVEFDGIFVN